MRKGEGSGDEGRVGGCGDPGRGAWALPLLLPSLPPLPSPPNPSAPGSEASEPAVGGRAAAAGRGGGLRSLSRKRRAHRPPRDQCVRALDPAMWGLLLALAAFAPAVEVDLGAPSTAVLGLATTKAPVPTPRSSPAQPAAGKKNGELPSYPRPASPANRLSHSSDPRVATPPQHARTHLTHATHAALCLAPGWRPCPTRTHSLRGTMAADSAALVPGQTKSAVLGQEPVGCCFFQPQTFLFLGWGN